MNADFQLTNRLKKEFASLDDAKGRRKTGLFVAEGTKCVLELMARFRARYIFALPAWLEEHADAVASAAEAYPAAPATLRELTRLTTTPPVIAFFDVPEKREPSPFDGSLILMLDRVQDPGNLGTILRTCDWMGVSTVIASPDTVDCFNPKVVQATMGGLARVNVVYTDLVPWLDSLPAGTPVYGTFLDGTNLYRTNLTPGGVVIMGNEGRGISPEVGARVNSRLFIPPYGNGGAVESLNVATATAIVLAQFRSRMF